MQSRVPNCAVHCARIACVCGIYIVTASKKAVGVDGVLLEGNRIESATNYAFDLFVFMGNEFGWGWKSRRSES
jgi:hypothetical protein